LINAVYDGAKNAGSPRVYWLTHETNQAARELYDKVAENSGFVMVTANSSEMRRPLWETPIVQLASAVRLKRTNISVTTLAESASSPAA
jgi:hypothetical protein